MTTIMTKRAGLTIAASTLASILLATKRIDSVFAAYRVLPGHAKAGA